MRTRAPPSAHTVSPVQGPEREKMMKMAGHPLGRGGATTNREASASPAPLNSIAHAACTTADDAWIRAMASPPLMPQQSARTLQTRERRAFAGFGLTHTCGPRRWGRRDTELYRSFCDPGEAGALARSERPGPDYPPTAWIRSPPKTNGGVGWNLSTSRSNLWNPGSWSWALCSFILGTSTTMTN